MILGCDKLLWQDGLGGVLAQFNVPLAVDLENQIFLLLFVWVCSKNEEHVLKETNFEEKILKNANLSVFLKISFMGMDEESLDRTRHTNPRKDYVDDEQRKR